MFEGYRAKRQWMKEWREECARAERQWLATYERLTKKREEELANGGVRMLTIEDFEFSKNNLAKK